MAYLFRFLWSGFLFVSTSSPGRKRIKAQVSVKYHKDDVVSRTKFQLSCDAEGETSGTWRGSSADETQPATSDHGSDDFFCSDVQIGSEGEEEEDTLHYQRLRRAEEAWSKVREGALLTTLQNEASLMGTQCLFCAENRGRNRRNVERFLCAYYISAGQTSLLQVQWKFYIGTWSFCYRFW